MIKCLPLIIKRQSSFTVLRYTQYNIYSGELRRFKIMDGTSAKTLTDAINIFEGKLPFVIFDGKDHLVTNEHELILALVEFS